MHLEHTNRPFTTLPYRPKPTSEIAGGEDSDKNPTMLVARDNDDAVVAIHPLESRDAVLVKVDPPLNPPDATTEHIPCDIVLVIDVSGSMRNRAPAPGYNEQGKTINEDLGLSILDLVKHAARTIVSTLNENDRLGIVTFESGPQIVQELTSMTGARRAEVNNKISTMSAGGGTNLWGGIRKGLELFESPNESEDTRGRVPALMVLTDGQPNTSCPPEGYVRRLRSIMQSTQAPLPAIINTFGFGFDIESGLLKSIAEVSNGNFSFIPDVGMIGTVFIHAVAHLQSTYATRCTLEVSAPKGVLLRTTTGKSIDQPQDEGEGSMALTIELGNLQYGQSRDIYLENVDESGQRTTFDFGEDSTFINATLTYSRMLSPNYVTLTRQDLRETSSLPRPVVAYHESRSMICKLLSVLSHLRGDLKYGILRGRFNKAIDFESFRRRLCDLIDSIPAKDYKDKFNESLMEDLRGQISEAVSEPEYYYRWGDHYFYSLRNAHISQLCNSFKDPGPLMYNNNPFFIRCRDRLNDAFDSLPPPPPSLRPPQNYSSLNSPGFPSPDFPYKTQAAPVALYRCSSTMPRFSMSKYNNASNPCFAAESPVMLATGRTVPIGNLRPGTMVRTPVGNRRVKSILSTIARQIPLCCVRGVSATPWHPMKTGNEDDDQKGWVFPEKAAESRHNYSGYVYSVLLEPDENPDAHAILMGDGDVWGVTLGHGILSDDDDDDIRAHPFLGDYEAVSKELMALDSCQQDVYSCYGVKRDPVTRMVCGFQRTPES
ncbi:U-box domain-containing protein [Xylaria intraflava]|nr:U-box domain-containing protein [Xylaria intraflava]